ncbi:MAG: ABC transporter permease subunit [Armatimonadota bacterium]
MKRSPLIGYLLVFPAVAVFALYVAYPLLHTVVLSAYSWSPVDPQKIYLGLDNFIELCTDPNFGVALRNNAYFIIISLAVQMPLAMALAVGLNSAIRRHQVLRTIFFSPFVLPVVAVGLAWQLIYEPSFGALNALLEAFGLHSLTGGWLGEPQTAIIAIIAVSCWRYTGFHMMIQLAGLQAIPDELYESARIDGASRWQIFTHLTLPSMRRILLVDALLITVGSVKIFDLVQVITGGGPGYATDVLATYMYRSAFTYDRMGYSAAIAVVMLVLTLILTVFYVRLTTSEVEGRGRGRAGSLVGSVALVAALTVLASVTCGIPPELAKVLIAAAAGGALVLVLWGLCAASSPLLERLPDRFVAGVRDVSLSILSAVMFLPILWSLFSAVKPQNELLLSPWSLPKQWAWENLVKAWHGGVGLFLLNSALVTTLSVLVMLVLATAASYALARLRLRGGTVIFGVILGGLLVPVHSALLPLFQLNNALGISEYAAVIGPYIAFCIPLSVLLLRAYFQEIPQELSDAAMMDGAGHLRILWSIFVPVARPALATVAIFQAAWVWNELLFAMVFLNEKAHMTIPVGLLTFQGEHATNWAVVMAGVAISIVPVLVLYFIFQRHIVRGLTAGAVK